MEELVSGFFPGSRNYWTARFLFYRGLFLTYLTAFVVAYRQFCPLVGVNGLMPFTRWLEDRTVLAYPSLLHFLESDRDVRILSIAGIVLAIVGLFGIEWLGALAVGICLFALWVLYLSLVKAGGLFYGYGWESLLLETGFLSLFLGGAKDEVPVLLLFLLAWLQFRNMFGAGMIKVRGDRCWRDLTCMDFHYETQPMPNPLSWFAHHMPKWWHKLEVLGNHFTELIVPFFYFFPQPFAGAAALLTIGFQGWLMLTGNFSWLNFLTGVIAVPLIPDSFFVFGLDQAIRATTLTPISLVHELFLYGYLLLVLVLSYWPATNLLSSRQVMNAGFDPFNLVNTYGAFGSITKTRHELVVQGRKEGMDWKTFEFKGKPTDPYRRPSQWAPYHLRLDWQLWFAAMPNRHSFWLIPMLSRLLEQDEEFLNLLQDNPFNDSNKPDKVRILRCRYCFSEPNEWWNDGKWWNREFVEEVIPPMSREDLDRRIR